MPFQPGNKLGSHGNHARGFECRNREMLQNMRWVHKGEEGMRVPAEELDIYLAAGWDKGRPPISEETRARQSASQSARTDRKRDATTPEGRRKRQYKCRYKKTPEDYAIQLETQSGHCALCPSTGSVKRRLCWDHDHRCCSGYLSCGKCVRGLLCIGCNNLVGKLETFLHGATYIPRPCSWEQKALDYLAKYPYNPVSGVSNG